MKIVLTFSYNIFLVSARCVLSFLCLKLVSEFSWQSIPSSRPLWRLQLTSLRMEHCLMAQYSIFDFMPITCNILQSTDYEHPMKPFFHWSPDFLGLGRQIGRTNSRAFEVFSVELSATILVQWVPCPCFSLFNHHFYSN